jgi:uncharacterized protein (TIGR04255 family)
MTYVQAYSKPPITEAVVEIRFQQLSDADLRKTAKGLRGGYANFVEQVQHSMSAPLTNPLDVSIRKTPLFQLSSPDQTELSILGQENLVISQRAPYPGWEAFVGRIQRDYLSFKKSLGYRRLTRIGLRYINRIDIPNDGSGVTIERHFVNFDIEVPEVFGTMNGYHVACVLPRPDFGGFANLNSGTIISPIAQHTSVMLDIDLYKEKDLPQEERAIFDLLEVLRIDKNKLFESCVTDAARKLFA